MIENNERIIEYNLYDRYDPQSRTSSMARTTGYTCTAVAHLVLNGDYREKGISPPEYLGTGEKCFQKILAYLRERNIDYIKKEH